MDAPETWITPLTPLAFLRRSAAVYPDKTAIVHGSARWTYAEFGRDAQRLARGLQASGVGPGDRVACLLPNVPAMLVAHFGVPLAGAVLVAVNTRLSGEEVRYILDHSGATVLVVDSALWPTVSPVLEALETVREVITLVDRQGPHADGAPERSEATWEDLLARGEDGADLPWAVDDERSTISINYTSGTTGRPKGVQYHHRGAYLNSVGEIVHSGHDPASIYLWTLPMFHCNGWCTPWALTAIGGTHVCLREVRGDAIWSLIDEHRVTHLNGAPTVVTTIMNAEQARTLDYALVVTTAGAPPSPTTILEMERMGFRIVHVYGLTETYGPYTVCQWQEAWRDHDPETRAKLQSRQGVAMLQAEPIRVVELLGDEADLASAELVDVPADGTTMGEIVMAGNNVMSGYYRDDDATVRAFAGGWYHSGDLGVMHPDGYVELRDRAKDVIVSGGENISTVEVEQAVLSHAAVLEAAVVGVPDEQWGERPKAFVVLREGRSAEPDEIIEHVKGAIARYKAPREVEMVDELPKTSTGKIQKFELRAKEWGEGTAASRGESRPTAERAHRRAGPPRMAGPGRGTLAGPGRMARHPDRRSATVVSEQFADHPDAVGDESGALDSEPSVVTDEDRLGTDPLEDGMDTAEGWSRDIRLGGTRASEETDTLDERLPQEVPDVGEGEIGAEPGRPVAATPAMELDASVDAPEHSVDGVGGDADIGEVLLDPLSPDGAVEARTMTDGDGEIELGASSAAGAVEPTGLVADDGVGEASAVENEWATEGAEAQALHVEQER